MPDVTIKLQKPIIGHGGQVTEITLREPTYRDIMRIGEPFAHGYSRDGSVVYEAENIDAMKSYIEVLLKPAENGPQVDVGLLNQLCMADTLQLKAAVRGFFSAARSTPSAAT